MNLPKSGSVNLRRGSLLDWMKTVRLPNVFTVIADVLASSVFAGLSISHWYLILPVTISAILMYWSGMVLNDCNDVEEDQLQTRRRPIADGLIDVGFAYRVGYFLMLTGVGIASITGFIVAAKNSTSPETLQPYLMAIVAIGLAWSIYVYDSRWKRTVVGPWLMGACRCGSMLMGIALAASVSGLYGVNKESILALVLGHGVYIVGVTWAARNEAAESQSWVLPFGWLLVAVGVVSLALVPWLSQIGIEGTVRSMRLSPSAGYPIAIGILSLPTIRRSIDSLRFPTPPTIQASIKQAILSIVFYDALLALQFGGPWYGIAVCSLILPATMIGKYLRST